MSGILRDCPKRLEKWFWFREMIRLEYAGDSILPRVELKRQFSIPADLPTTLSCW